MEDWLEFAPFVLFLLLALGGGLLKKYIEKQQAEKDAAQRQTRGTAAKPTRPTPAGERRIQARPQEPLSLQQTIAPPPPGPGPRPTPAAARRQEPPGVAVARQAIRQKAPRRGAPARAARGRGAQPPAEEQPESVPVGPAAERPAAAPSAAPRPAAGFLGTMLRGRNAARAVVLSEILGPPKGFQDL
ncbi:MAG TPA: hypothetical protein VM238_07700 [Phycisphaerae bacterium]|nr:hypothetical protein [Phycisphaerae bacterium]